MLQLATEALRNLARDERTRRAMVSGGVVPPLVKICSGCQDAEVLAFAVGAIVNLAHNEANRPQIVRDGAVRQLVQLCTWSSDDKTIG